MTFDSLRPYNRRMRTLAIAVSVLALVACSSDKDDKKTKPTGDKVKTIKSMIKGPSGSDVGGKVACAMLTTKQASEILGVEVGAGKPDTYNCIWQSKTHKMKMVLLEVRTATKFDQARDIAKQMESDKFEELSGVGDSAFYGAMLGHNVVFKKGNRYAQLTVVGDRSADAKKRTIDWAKKLAAEM